MHRTSPEAVSASHPEPSVFDVVIREGVATSVFRSSLVWALIKLDASARAAFLEVSYTEQQDPHVGYVHWRELPNDLPRDPGKIALGVRGLLERSLLRLPENVRDSDTNQTTHRSTLPPLTRQELAISFPDVVVLDMTGAVDHVPERMASCTNIIDVMNFVRHQYANLPPCRIIRLLHKHSLKRISHAAQHFSDPFLCVDVPSTRAELDIFSLAWNQMLGRRDNVARALATAHDDDSCVLDIFRQLGMGDPLKVGSIFDGEQPLERRAPNQATFDLFCAVSALMQDGRQPRTIAQLCEGLRERLSSQQQADVEDMVQTFLLLGRFDSQPNHTSLEEVAALFEAVDETRLWDPIDFEHIYERLAFSRALSTLTPKLAASSQQRTMLRIFENPVLTSMLVLEEPDAQQSLLSLTAEHLALGFFALTVVKNLPELAARNLRIAIIKIGALAALMHPQAWARCLDAIFDLLDDQHDAYAARQMLNICYFSHLVYACETARAENDDVFVESYESSADDQSLPTPVLDALIALAEEDGLAPATAWEPYANETIRVSLHHNLHTGATIPEAWAFWVGRPCEGGLLTEELKSELDPISPQAVADHVSYLRGLLSAPPPICDNAARLLRYVDKRAAS